MKIVIKGLPTEATADFIAHHLQEKGLYPVRITRKTSKRTREQLDMFFVTVSKKEGGYDLPKKNSRSRKVKRFRRIQ